MKILVSAIACDPYAGSESYFGWSAVKCLSRDHEVWVVTREMSRESLARAKAEGLVPDNMRFLFVGRVYPPWSKNPMMERAQNWKRYLDFNRKVFAVSQKAHQRIAFDLAHHVTYATWRVSSPLWRLGIPFVFGPVGGYEQFPIRFASVLSSAAKLFEAIRMLSNLTSRLSPAVRACIRHAAHVLVANAETEELVRRIRGSHGGVTRLSPAVYATEKMQPLVQCAASKELNGPLRLFAGGLIEGRKGIALALEALAGAKRKGVQFRYRLGGAGPERSHFIRIAASLGLKQEVCFGETLRGEAYQRELGASHVYLLPSFRDSAGLTMMEAMLAKCVPIVADCGGPGHIVTDSCGFKIQVTTLSQMIADLEAAIIAIDRQRQLITQFGAAASKRIAGHFSEDNYRRIVNSVYQPLSMKKWQMETEKPGSEIVESM